MPVPLVKITFSRSSQPSNISPVISKEIGTVIVFSPVQSLNAFSPTDVTLSGMTISSRLAQPSKAPAPMDSTLPGIVIEVIAVFAKALSPMVSSPSLRVIVSRFVFAKAPSPMDSTLPGIVIIDT